MEALIYDESPIAEYLEADAVPFDHAASPPPSPCTLAFAPTGLPKLREQLRTIRETAASVTDVANELFLERFRYIVIASQLLSDDSKPRRQVQSQQPLDDPSFSVRGALITGVLSFSLAWLLHTLRRRHYSQQSLPLSDKITHTLVLFGGCLLLFHFARRQYLEFIRRSAAGALGDVVTRSHNLDSIVAEALRFIQEIEVVSRGYDISQPLPPVSRLDSTKSPGHSRHLRTAIAQALSISIRHCADSHHTLQPYIRDSDLQRYHDIYEVSMQDFADAIALTEQSSEESPYLLKDLRILFRLHFATRKIFLCDLLAFHSGSTWQNIKQWRATVDRLQDLNATYLNISGQLSRAMADESNVEDSHEAWAQSIGSALADEDVVSAPHRLHTKAQIRRFDAVANAIRSLNAKVRLVKDDLDSLIATGDDSTYSTALTRHYENLGADIRNALVEWEKGRNTMFLNVGTENDKRLSSASSFRSPASPSPSSLGGQTVFDGSPAEALKSLVGDQRRHSDESLDEQVFEAIALPRKRTSWAPMSREEKLNKMQEERRKRATMHEHAENTTNMLRELQMVIKHRPNTGMDTRIMSV